MPGVEIEDPSERSAQQSFDRLSEEALSAPELAAIGPTQRAYLEERLANDRDELLEEVTSSDRTSSRRSLGALRDERTRLISIRRRNERVIRRLVWVGRLVSAFWTLIFLFTLLAVKIDVGGLMALFVFLSFGIAGLVAFVSPRADARLRRSNWRWGRIHSLSLAIDEASQLLETREADRRARLERAIQDRLRLHFNRISGPSYSLRLPLTQTTGLAETLDPLFVPTKASQALLGMLDSMPNGTIGLAGPRGAGKTTLIRRACEQEDRGKPDPQRGDGSPRPRKPLLGILVSAPVEFDGREFLLHLIAELCWRTLGGSPANARGAEPARVRGQRSGRQARFAILIAAGTILMVLGGLVLAGVLEKPSSSVSVGTSIVVAGLVLVTVAIGWNIPRLAEPGQLFWPDDGYSSDTPGSEAIKSRARELLESIKFQQTYTSGWSGGLKLPIGLEVGRDRGATRAAIPMSLPEVAAALTGFLELLATEWRVVVGIDELDKMDSDLTARRFLNEVKVVFGVTGCFFLVSVSEDAMGSFERRGMPFRDVFDSSLDGIVNVPYLDLRSSARMLAERVVGLPEQFVCLCHCLGAGLPRDVIRVARETVELSGREPSLALVARVLIEREIANKGRAASVTLSRVRLEPDLSACLVWIRETTDGEMSAAVLLERCEAFAGGKLSKLIAPIETGRERVDGERQQISAIALELVTFEYYAATVLQLLDDRLTESRYRELTDPAGEEPIERLTGARQAFGVSARIAWEQVGSAREAAGLRVVTFPFPWDASAATVPSH